MKKFYYILCVWLLAALSSQAQGFEFQFQGQSLADGETITIAAEEDLFGELSCETNNAANPADGLMMKMLNGMNVTATATMQISHNSMDVEMLQWCMGGECTPFNNQTLLTKRFSVSDETQVQFDAVGIHSEGYLMATLKVTVGLESHKVNICFVNGDIDGIEELQAQGQEVACYDLYGRKLQGKPSSSGIYIVTDGKHIRKIMNQ